MAASSKVNSSSEELFEFMCGPCNVYGEVLQAKGYCSDCQDYLCDLCFKTHIRPKPMRYHVLLDEKAMPKGKMTTSINTASDICTERCEKHSGNIIEYYCQNHDFLGCSKCLISNNHRKCEGVVGIDDAASNIYISLEHKTVEEKQRCLTNALESVRSNMIQCEEEATLGHTRLNDNFKTFRAKLNTHLDNLEEKIDIKALQMHDEQSATFKHISQDLDEINFGLNKIKDSCDKKKLISKHCDSFIAMKTDLKKTEEYQDRVEAIRADIEKITAIVFQPNHDLEKSITTVKRLGILQYKSNNAEQKVRLTDTTGVCTPHCTKAEGVEEPYEDNDLGIDEEIYDDPEDLYEEVMPFVPPSIPLSKKVYTRPPPVQQMATEQEPTFGPPAPPGRNKHLPPPLPVKPSGRYMPTPSRVSQPPPVNNQRMSTGQNMQPQKLVSQPPPVNNQMMSAGQNMQPQKLVSQPPPVNNQRMSAGQNMQQQKLVSQPPPVNNQRMSAGQNMQPQKLVSGPPPFNNQRMSAGQNMQPQKLDHMTEVEKRTSTHLDLKDYLDVSQPPPVNNQMISAEQNMQPQKLDKKDQNQRALLCDLEQRLRLRPKGGFISVDDVRRSSPQ